MGMRISGQNDSTVKMRSTYGNQRYTGVLIETKMNLALQIGD
jgi:hypothetical protein